MAQPLLRQNHHHQLLYKYMGHFEPVHTPVDIPFDKWYANALIGGTGTGAPLRSNIRLLHQVLFLMGTVLLQCPTIGHAQCTVATKNSGCQQPEQHPLSSMLSSATAHQCCCGAVAMVCWCVDSGKFHGGH